MLPLLVGGAVQANPFAPLAMGAGMATSFALAGLVLGALGPALGIDGDTLRQVGAGLLIALALVMVVPSLTEGFARWVSPLASSAQMASTGLDSGSLGGAFLLGAMLGLVWSPCSGPLLASTITLVAAEGGALQGALGLGLFGVGAALPLVAVGYASRRWVSGLRAWLAGSAQPLRRAFAVLIGVTGVAILTGADKWLEAWVLDLLPDSWIRLTTLI